jgi:hypothetical protein
MNVCRYHPHSAFPFLPFFARLRPPSALLLTGCFSFFFRLTAFWGGL